MMHDEAAALVGANPYLDAFMELHGQRHPDLLSASRDIDDFAAKYRAREELVRKYAWAVPTPEAIEAIANLGHVVEVGAGTGYWARLLQEAGTTVEAFDIEPNPFKNHYVTEAYTLIKRGGPEVAMRDGREHWTLLLCWPPYQNMMAYTALSLHKGEHLVYVGEDEYGCTANEDFFALRDERYEHERTVYIPQWLGLHDYMEIWRKR